jgi:hypothetical protein
VQPEMVAYRTHHEITCLRVIDKRGEEELLFLVKVPDGAPEIEVDEIVRDVRRCVTSCSFEMSRRRRACASV